MATSRGSRWRLETGRWAGILTQGHPWASPSEAGCQGEKGTGLAAHRGPRVSLCPSATVHSVTQAGALSLRHHVTRTVQGTGATGPTVPPQSNLPSPHQARWLSHCPAGHCRVDGALVGVSRPEGHPGDSDSGWLRTGTVCQAFLCVSAQVPKQTSPRLLLSPGAEELRPGTRRWTWGGRLRPTWAQAAAPREGPV